mmetsp:Transcript_36100/g.82412  ORF Transcript_36100/g.82412 Transcript_36100/m.82412 type:complete len:658 (+) Transcript_36100:270-2243(+)
MSEWDSFDPSFWDDAGPGEEASGSGGHHGSADAAVGAGGPSPESGGPPGPSPSGAGKQAAPGRAAAMCPNCGSRNIESLGPSGSSVCTDCGIIVEENTIVSSVEFVEGAGGSSSMVGQYVGANSARGFGTGARRGQYGFSRQSRENTLASGRRRIQDVAALMRLGPHLVDAAHRLFTVAVERNFVQGRKRSHVIAACLYTSCRQEKSQHMLIDFSDALQINVYVLGTCFLKFRRLLGLKLEIIDPALFVYRFAAHLDLGDGANRVAMSALRLVARMKRDWIVAGRRPAGICAAALLIASRAHGYERQHADVTKVLRVCGVTVMKRVREFENTPSSGLSLGDFHDGKDAGDGGGGVGPSEADPPAFTANRRREARARAVAAGDVELLTSGALDNPDLKGKHSSKWRRDKRSTDRSREMTEMYSQLETDLMEGAAEAEIDAAGDADTGVERKGRPAVSFTRADEAYEPVRPAAVSTLHDTIAYPTGKNQRPVVLPDQATAEELSAPTQRCEDVLDFGAWRDAVPPGAEDEVTYLFRSDDEVAEREAVFNAQNREYLDLQRQREDDRLEAEAAARSKLEDEAAQEEGRRRYLKTSRSRKRRDGLDPHELTTEEALMEVVRTRKISRKINYDAMSSLFDDDGQFSTDLLSDATRNKKEEAM